MRTSNEVPLPCLFSSIVVSLRKVGSHQAFIARSKLIKAIATAPIVYPVCEVGHPTDACGMRKICGDPFGKSNPPTLRMTPN